MRSEPESLRVWPTLPRLPRREIGFRVGRLEPESRRHGLPWAVRRRESLDEVRGYGGAWRTPGTLVLGVGCQPIERENWLVAERVPERDSN